MKFAIIGDLHFKKTKDIETNYRNKVMAFVRNYLKENNIQNIIQLGDVFHERKTLDINLIKETKDILNKYFDFNVSYIIGNHDTYFKNTNTVNSLELITENIIDTPKNIDNSLLLPWITEDNYQASIQLLAESKQKYCFGHFEINGFQLMKGILAEEKLDSSVFKNFKKVFSGHYHLPQETRNIVYVGSLFQNDFGDEGTEKRFFVLDDETDELTEVKIPYTLFKKIELKDESDLDMDIDSLKDKIVKCVVYIPTSIKREQLLDKITENLTDYSIIDNSKLAETQNNFVADEDFVNIFSDYLGQNQGYDENRKNDLSKLFVETYSKLFN